MSSTLLGEEKQLFDSIVELFDKFRYGIVANVLELKSPYVNQAAAEPAAEQTEAKPVEEKKETKRVRFLHPVPKFIGQELESYGPFEEEDMATLPSEIADVLISKERAEEITEG